MRNWVDTDLSVRVLPAPTFDTNRLAATVLLVIAALLFAVPGPALAGTQSTGALEAEGSAYYVATNGSDANPGSLQQPWRTLAKANDVLQAGDTVFVRAGTYDGYIEPERSGTSGSKITYTTYQNEAVTLRGQAGIDKLVSLPNQSYVVIDGFTLTYGHSPPGGERRWSWVHLGLSGHHNEIRNCTIHRPGDPLQLFQDGYREYGIVLSGTTYNLIEGNTISGVNQGIHFKNAPHYNVIRNNTITSTGQSSITVGSSKGVMQGNLIEDNLLEGSAVEDGIQFLPDQDLPDGPLREADISNFGTIVRGNVFRYHAENAIDLKGAAYVIIEDNIIYGIIGSSNGPLYGWNRDAHASITRGNGTSTRDVVIRNNVIFDSSPAIRAHQGYKIYHNTLVGNNRDYTGPNSEWDTLNKPNWTGIRQKEAGDGGIGIQNNVFVGHNSVEVSLLLTENQNGTSHVDHNLYFNTYGAFSAHVRAPGDWDKLTLSMWQRRLESFGSITGHEEASFYADPMFIDAPERPVGEHNQFDFRLRDYSPAIDTGGALTRTSGAGSGTSIGLQDARYFTDGMGVTPGDEIQVGGRSPVRITSVNYASNQITVDGSLSWGTGDAVVLAYNGTAPDLGAHECQGACPPAQPPVVDARVSNGLQALYTFNEGGGSTVHDVSGAGQPLDLTIDDLGAVNWLDGALDLRSPAIITSAGAATKINAACRASDELTVEAWIEPDNITQDGPARIVTLSPDTKERNFTLGQGLLYRDEQPEVFDVRLRTTQQSDNGEPSLWTLDGATTTELSQVVYTRESDGTARIYVNDELQIRSTVGGDFSGWDQTYPLTLGNEPVGERPWLGKLHLVALYCRALSHAEIGQNHAFGLQTCYTLTSSADPSGSGSVSAAPAPNCGSGAYAAGTQVTLTAEPGPGSTFDRWSGALSGSANPDSLTMGGNRSVTAHFAQADYRLDVTTSGGGTVDVDPDQATYHHGDTVQLTAIPDPGKSFTGWSGDLLGTSNPAILTIEGDTSVTANFGAAAVGPLVYDGHSMDDDESGASSGDGDGLAECGETLELAVNLRNQGASPATGVGATLSSASPYVSCSVDTSAYPDIAAGATAQNNQPFVCGLLPGTPNGHIITFDLEATASDGGPWTEAFDLTASCAGGSGSSLEIRVAASTDDAEERMTDGDMALKGSDLELVQDSQLQTVGLRFQNVSLPQGASIARAYVEFWADEVQTGATDLTFHGQASDDAATFSSGAYDITGRSRTTALVPWNDIAPWLTVHDAYQSPDLSPIIQEIVNRPGWDAGQSLALIISGSGRRTAESYNSEPSLAPRLHVEYGGDQTCYTLTTAADPASGGTVSASPAPNCSGGQYLEGSAVQLTATANPSWTFSGWSGDLSGSSNPATITMDGAKSVTAGFSQDTYSLTVNIVGGGTVSRNPDLAAYPPGTQLQLTAQPDSGWTFAGWSGDLGGSANPAGLTMDGDKTVTATFGGGSTGSIEVLAIESNDDAEERLATGDVARKGSDLELGVDSAPQMVGMRFQNVGIPQGASITGAAIEFRADEAKSEATDLVFRGQDSDDAEAFTWPDYNITHRPQTAASVNWDGVPAWNTVHAAYQSPNLSALVQEIVNRPGWTAGNSLAILVTGTGRRTAESYDGAAAHGDVTLAPKLRVEFGGAQTCYTLTTGIDPAAGGSVNRNPAPNCGSLYLEGTQVQLTANPASDYGFDGWSGDLTGSNNPATLTMDGDRLVTASFSQEAAGYSLTANISGSGSVNRDPDQALYQPGAQVQLTATPAAGWTFEGWSGDLGGTDNPASLTMDGNKTVTATFSGGSGSGSLDAWISASSDDGEEKLTDGGVAVKSVDLELGEDSKPQIVGLRFVELAIPQGASITSAAITFSADELHSGDTDLTIQGQASDDTATFVSLDNNLSNRPRTAASVGWPNVPPWTAVHAAYQTPDLSAVVQEIVNRPGWQAGNSLAILITGSGRRTAESYNGATGHGDLGLAPQLHVEYGTGGGPVCHSLTAGIDPAASGSVSRDPAPNCGAEYIEGTQVQLTASPGGGYSFDHWSGDLGGSTNPATLTMGGDRSVTAHMSASSSGPLVYGSHIIDDDQQDDSDGNGDGIANCGESIELYVDLSNQGTTAVSGINATLSTSDPYVTWILNPDSPYPDLAAGASGANQDDYDLSIDAAIPHGHSITLDLLATGNEGGPWSDSFSIPVTCGGGSSQSLDVRIGDTYDDAEERLISGDMILKGSDLEMVEDSSTQTVGLRFQNITVPRGATISGATIEFAADEVHSGDTDLTFHGQAADDAEAFDNDAEVSTRPKTSTSADWTNVPPWTAEHNLYTSPDLAPIIQEIVGRGGWTSGNSLVIIITGSGRRVAESYDGRPELAPKLHIDYLEP